MQNRSSKTSGDMNLLAKAIVDEATSQPAPPKDPEPEKNPAAVALGRLGGLKGGRARAEKLTAKRRQEIAKNAAEMRWAKRDR